MDTIGSTAAPVEEVQRRADRAANDGLFLGGPRGTFAQSGVRQLRALVGDGMVPQSMVADVGCGALRGGYWLIHHLDSGRYCGVEPSEAFLQTGLGYILESNVRRWKKPRFELRSDFDLSAFGETFDFVLAAGILNHAAKRHVDALFASFAKVATRGGVLLAQYKQAGRGRDYQGRRWVGRSHERGQPGYVRHNFERLATLGERCDLAVEHYDSLGGAGGPSWIRATRS
jgi:cyclopropane fatty-acyl-phospholipid synthase-like methyltransferase